MIKMSNLLVALFLAAGISGWTYSQAQRRNGGLTQKSVIVAAVCGVIAFIVMWTVLILIFN